LKSSETHR